MKRLGAIVFFAGSLLLSIYILAPAESPRVSPEAVASSLAALAQSRPIVDTVTTETNRLRERLAERPAYPPPTRDPFRFGAARPKETPVSALAEAAAPPPVAAVPALPRLIAIATTALDGVQVLTAVVAVGDDVRVVKTGEIIARLSIQKIEPDAVELLDPSTGRTFKLSLQ